MGRGEAAVALSALTAINLLNYFTRYIPSATKDLIKHDLNLTDFQTGFMFTSFITCYMVVSPLIGFIADKRLLPRKVLIVVGVLILSAATSATGLCNSFATILVPRILFGVGEAIFGTLAPSLLCDHFPPEQRSVALSVFMSATPIGCALGYAIAGTMGEALGWRLTFLVLGAPGLLSLLFLIPREPEMGALDPKEVLAEGEAAEPPPPLLKGFWMLLTNPNYMFAVGGYVAVTFGMGGFSDWLPTLFVRYLGMSMSYAGLLNGAIVVIAGLTGTIAGAITGLKLSSLGVRQPLLAISGVTMTLSTVGAGLSLWYLDQPEWVVELLFILTVFLGWWYNGPVNTLINNSVPANLRSRANGLSILAIHLLGDSISPSIIGIISDATGGDLRNALAVVPATLAIASELWIIGWWLSPELQVDREHREKVEKERKQRRLKKKAGPAIMDEEKYSMIVNVTSATASMNSLDSMPILSEAEGLPISQQGSPEQPSSPV